MAKTSKKRSGRTGRRLDVVSLIAAYDHYIKLLEEEGASTFGLAFCHGWRPKADAKEKGELARARIAKWKKAAIGRMRDGGQR